MVCLSFAGATNNRITRRSASRNGAPSSGETARSRSPRGPQENLPPRDRFFKRQANGRDRSFRRPVGASWIRPNQRRKSAMKSLFKIAGFLGILGGFFLLERRQPLRSEKESKTRRNGRNLAVAALGALTIHFAESPVIYPLARVVERRGWGLLKSLKLPRLVEVIAAVLLLDYTLYLQHVLHHRAPLLWRFHAVHHV